MLRRTNHDKQKLDGAVTRLIKASDPGADEIDRFAESIDYRKVRARVAAGQRGPDPDTWDLLLVSAIRAIPALCLIAMVAFIWSWLARVPVATASLNNAITGAAGAGTQRVRAGGTCAISTSEQCYVSTEDVLATLVKGENR
jgi:hypothetical protein